MAADPSARPGMVGREFEQAELAATLDEVRTGRGRAVLVLGEPGMGKSTLADWLAQHASAAGLRVARGPCSAAGMPPLWPWRCALDSIAVPAPWQDVATPWSPSDSGDGTDPATARFTLAEGTHPVFVDETSPAYLGGLPDLLAAAASVLPLLTDAFRTGDGVPYAAYGPDGVAGQAALTRPAFVNALVDDWLPHLPDLRRRLQDTTDPARVADLGCGAGWAAIELAKAFPHITVDGRDNDEASIARGRTHALDHGVADRVNLEVVDLADASADWSPRYDLVLFVECVHDFPRPVEALHHARLAVRPGGTVLVVDERAAETFTAPGDDVERFFAAGSAVWCLPQGRVGPDPEPVGTLIRPGTMRALAQRAGYTDIAVVPIEHPFWRFYRLTP